MGQFDKHAMAEKMVEWESRKKKPKIRNDTEYMDGLSVLRVYFRRNPDFDKEEWMAMTYLLQAICKWEKGASNGAET